MNVRFEIGIIDIRPLRNMPTIRELRKREEKLLEDVENLLAEFNAEDEPGSTEGAVDLEKKAQRITSRSHKNTDDIEKCRELNRLESEAGEIEQKIREIQKELEEIPRTESRLYALVEEEFVRLKLRSKPLVDAVRITARNIFIRSLYIFRRLWDNHRNDHSVLRALTRSSGVIVPRGNTLEVVLRPELDLQPAETVNP